MNLGDPEVNPVPFLPIFQNALTIPDARVKQVLSVQAQCSDGMLLRIPMIYLQGLWGGGANYLPCPTLVIYEIRHSLYNPGRP